LRHRKAALEELKQANQNDPFIQCMIGQTFEKLGDKDKAFGVLPQSFNSSFAQSSRGTCCSLLQEETVLTAWMAANRMPLKA
jgi:hypothetical protein